MYGYQERWNPPHGWLLAFCGGVIGLRFFPELPALAPLAAAALVMLAAAVRWRVLRPLAGFALGIAWAATVATVVMQRTLPVAMEKQDVAVVGEVRGVPKVGAHNVRFDFAVETLHWGGVAHPSPGTVRLRWYLRPGEVATVRGGQRWRMTVRLKRARGYRNPGANFDYEAYLLHHRIRATGYVRTPERAELLRPRKPHSLSAFREGVAEFIRECLDSERAGLVAALVVGVRNDMRPRDWEVLLATGTIHLVAISGLHIGLVAGLMLLIGRWAWGFASALPLRLPAPQFGALAGLLGGVGYALLAGMTIPTRRAVCMLAVAALAVFFRRRAFSAETFILALAVVLMADPLAPLAGGLWLSFGAVAILMLAAARAPPPRQHHDMGRGRRLLKRLGQWSAMQAALFVGMAPLLLVLFQKFSLVAPLANLVAIPVIAGIAVPLALIGLIPYTLGLEGIAAAVFGAAMWVIDALWIGLDALAHARWSVWQQAAPAPWAVAMAAVGVLVLLAPRAVPARWSGLLWLLPLFYPLTSAPPAGEFRYTMLEVGNGHASVVQTANHALVYDAGPRAAGGFDAGESVVAPFLQHLGVRRVDLLVISHGDNDHSGGHDALAQRYPAARTLSGTPHTVAAAQPCRAGERWHWDGVTFEFLWPPSQAPQSANDASCVLKVSSLHGALLLTGDITRAVEQRLIGSGAAVGAEVLLAPHHGSKTSSSAAFLDRVRPHAILISSGYLNRHGHPHRSVRERYLERAIPTYNTAQEGALTVTFGASGIVVHGERGVSRRYWRQPPLQLAAPQRITAPGRREYDAIMP